MNIASLGPNHQDDSAEHEGWGWSSSLPWPINLVERVEMTWISPVCLPVIAEFGGCYTMSEIYRERKCKYIFTFIDAGARVRRLVVDHRPGVSMSSQNNVSIIKNKIKKSVSWTNSPSLLKRKWKITLFAPFFL